MEKIEVLKKLIDLLEDREWVLVGGMARKLQEIEAKTEDIDIVATADEAKEIDELLKDYAKRRLKYGETEQYESLFGVYEIDGVRVELMADLVLKGNESRFRIDFERMKAAGRRLKFEGWEIMVEPMEESLIAKVVIGEIERAKKLAKYLATNGYDDWYLERAMESGLADYVKEEVRELLIR